MAVAFGPFCHGSAGGTWLAATTAMGVTEPLPGLTGVPVLIVEDDPAGARLLGLLLTQAGAEVRVARTAEDAIAVLDTFAAGVLVVDVLLPSMDGLALVRHLKASPSTRDIVAIAVSVVDGAQAEQQARQAGCAAYVRKPIDVQTFVEIVLAHVKGMP